MGVWKFKYQKRNDIRDALSREEVKYDCNRFLVEYRRLIAARYEPELTQTTAATISGRYLFLKLFIEMAN